MKTIDKEYIKSEVRKKLDEINENELDEGFDVTEDENVDILIESCIAEAYRLVMLAAPVAMLEGVPASTQELNINKELVGTVTLPEDFLRLVNIRLNSWASSCSEFITEDEPSYRMQSNKWVCGNPQHPVVAVVETNDGKKLELYKANSTSDSLRVLTYIPDLSGDEESINVPTQLVGAFIYFTAALVSTTYREDVANDFFKLGRGLMGLE